ncbi:DUF1624 domain-containing protein [Pseudochryseolinea flava]|uniref:Heparan-alpha-glucosaminide N-acetyltransferase catalytic domain-containing protein n=1 Tax=Pseudochryseolinea flava TaxID=2059302 RepID=A0A364XWN1_9BACT|nr:heparan-alpha-glucosaminide N-acetyltransferase domain-containing protein [Pseudochryseolinea flava]RAV98376.1 hypothetical protein DQQ10_23895 [Pseudochryseolinea flava]
MTSTLSNGMLTQKSRIASIDILRGIVMVIMALDHTRDFFHIYGITDQPTNLETTTPILFFTRWITHYCAPTFVLLSGVAIRISTERKTTKELSLFLLTRGLWLILLEVVVVRFGLFFNFYYDFTFFQVIWVIGASMVVLAGLVFLPGRVVLGIGLFLIFFHNIFDFFPLKPEDSGYALWVILRQQGFLPLDQEHAIIVAYPLLPWLGIMALGYGIGEWFAKSFNAAKRFDLLLYSGAGAVLLFLILRGINVYGDPAPWSVQKDFTFTILSFLNVTKYPVSLLYTLMTVGPVLIILALMEMRQTPISQSNPFVIYGRVPMFYYILHFYLIHFTALVTMMIMRDMSFADLNFHFNNGFGGVIPGSGFSLPWVYLIWITIVASLYPLCKWYNRYKSTHSHWWLSYV